MLCSDEKYFTFDKGTGTITDYDVLNGGVDVRIPYCIGGEDVLHIYD